MAVYVSQATTNNAQPDPRHLINYERPGNAQDIRSQRCRQRRHGNHKYPGRNSSYGDPDYRIDEGKSASPLVRLSFSLQIQRCGPLIPSGVFAFKSQRWAAVALRPLRLIFDLRAQTLSERSETRRDRPIRSDEIIRIAGLSAYFEAFVSETADVGLTLISSHYRDRIDVDIKRRRVCGKFGSAAILGLNACPSWGIA